MDTDATAAAPVREGDNVIPMPGPGPFGEGMGTDAAGASFNPDADQVVVEPEAGEVEGEVEPSESPDLVELVEQALRVVFGVVSTVGAVITEALARSMGREHATTDEHADPTSVALLTGAALGLGFELGRRTLNVAASVTGASRPVWSWTTSFRPLRWPVDAAQTRLRALNDGWRDARPGAERAADEFTRTLVPEVVRAVLDQIDLTAVVRERVDIDVVADRLDLAAIVERIPIDDIIARIDMNRLVERVDVDAIVRRIDVDRVAERIDLDALIDRIDATSIAIEVIEAVDLPEIIRESSGAMASETVEGLRLQGMNADDRVSRVVDRLLRRREDRDRGAQARTSNAGAPRGPGGTAS